MIMLNVLNRIKYASQIETICESNLVNIINILQL
jgi:hypothetical protein